MASLPDILKSAEIHPALRSFAEESRAVIVRLMAYVGGLAALAFLVADIVSTNVPVVAAVDAPLKSGWTTSSRPHPAFAVSQVDFAGKTAGYEIRRHPEGGRKDILTWSGATGEQPSAEIEVFRLGGETPEAAPAALDIATRMGLVGAGEAEAAGVIDTKFGAFSLIRFPAQENRSKPCLAFAKAFDATRVHITGYACQADTIAAQRAFVGCMLNRLTLLAAGNDPKMAELFARSELKRSSCSANQAPGDWVSSLQEPQLRGRL